MKRYPGLERPSKPNWEGLVANILRRGTPDRTYHLELFQDDVKIDARHGFEDTIEDVCMPGGGYRLGTGNSVTNYIPPDNYLAMLDEVWPYGN